MNLPTPDPFLDVVVHDLGSEPRLCGLSVGYERGQWRYTQFADHLMEWLPEFSLTYDELEEMNHANAVSLFRKAAKIIYNTGKFKNRGEFGEILLHSVIRQVFNSIPAISKIYYKDSANDTIKGFDAVHVVDTDEGLELWIGEVKFYKDINAAIRDVIKELRLHTDTDYLRQEFALISNKIDKKWPHAEELLRLIHRNTTLDEVFKRACIPVLLTYESRTVGEHNSVCDDYTNHLKAEFGKHYKIFLDSGLPNEIIIHLILVPLERKEKLITCLDDKLNAWKHI
ncbi:HamA C-terminal domain-containing protein [Candidatus Thiosymbion oneisti]|uniref:HamA C-terminal domain-containing protein n=1 Tax=Candidatus Thiosymbion oneisti TaxID=589554 RepID=UPI00105F145F|nr:DUF1837 domain-containing protein [Candidatus Thiosymbion oneisti]